MHIQEILDRLNKEGFEHCFIDGNNPNQIIVNNRGEIELAYGEVRIYDRLAPWTTQYGNHPYCTNIDDLFADIYATWSPIEAVGRAPEPVAVVEVPKPTLMERAMNFFGGSKGCGGTCNQGRGVCDCGEVAK